jgi:signal transduction protein with GAF and PtsI domain
MKQSEKTYYQSLYKLVATLNSARSPQEIVHSVVEDVAKAMGAKGCSLMLLTPDKKVLLRTATYGLSEWYARKGPVFADNSISETLEGKPVAILDATADARIQYQKQLKEEGIASVLSVPVKLREKVIGVMRVYTSEPRHFIDADIDFASAAASFGAIALESARFYETIQKDYDTFVEEMLRWRADLGYEWMIEECTVTAKEPGTLIPPGG